LSQYYEMEEGNADKELHPEHNASAEIKKVRSKKVVLEWDNLNYWVRVKNSKQSSFMKSVYQNNRILDNVKGIWSFITRYAGLL
jgi:hypothetical protein